jgi:hypothetical protein
MYGRAPWWHMQGPRCCPWHQQAWEMAQRCTPQWVMCGQNRPGEPSWAGTDRQEEPWRRDGSRSEPWREWCREPIRESSRQSNREPKPEIEPKLPYLRPKPDDATVDKPQPTPAPERIRWPVAPELMAMADGGAVGLPHTLDATTPIWHDLGQLIVGKQLAGGVAVFTLSANIWVDVTEIPAVVAEDTEQNADYSQPGVEITFRVLDPRGEVLATRNVEYASGWCGVFFPNAAAGVALGNVRFPISFELYARYDALQPGETLQLQAALTAEPRISAITIKDLQWSALLWPQTP